jgi:hypothetical protein
MEKEFTPRVVLSMEEIRANKPVATLSKEHKELRGDVENDKPYWAEVHSAVEWRQRKEFELKCSPEDTYSAYVSDFSEFNV